MKFLSAVARVLVVLPGLAVLPGQQVDVVVSQLNNPRGLSFSPNGALYIAEAGCGGTGPCAAGAEGPVCFGATGSISRFDPQRNTAERVVQGLPSLAVASGRQAAGPHDISFQGNGNAYFIIGLGRNPATRALFGPASANLGQIARLKPNGDWEPVADLAAYELLYNPLGDVIDSNPYKLLALPGRRVAIDAGGNTLLAVAANGRQSTLAVFPDRLVPAPPFLPLPPGTQIPMQAVPTSVAVGPDGNYYVGQLTGFPFPVGGANVYRVPANGGNPEVVASGFSGIIGLTFGPDGSLYVLQVANNVLAAVRGGNWAGALFRIAPDGTRTELVPGRLTAPGGIAVARDGSLYVTNKSIECGTGEVLRIQR